MRSPFTPSFPLHPPAGQSLQIPAARTLQNRYPRPSLSSIPRVKRCRREKAAVSSSAQRLFLPGDIAHTMKEQTDCQKHTHSNRTACERYARYTAIRWQRDQERSSTCRTASADQQDTANSAPAAYSLAVSAHALSFQRE